MGLSGIVEGVVGNAAWSGFGAGVRKLLGQRIQITSPRPGEVLQDPQPMGANHSYAVSGTLKSLPKDHAIWLLVEDEHSRRVWPQGFSLVHYDQHARTWQGRVFDIKKNAVVKILAVVAPPTSDDFFHYFQNIGPKTNFAPLMRLPAECKNTTYVQARTR